MISSINNNNNNDDDNNYILFNKVFKNYYLNQYIFKIVKDINRNNAHERMDIYLVARYREGNTREYNIEFKKICMPYNDVPFQKIFQNGLVEMFQDRLKMKVCIGSNEPRASIQKDYIKFVYKNSISDEQFIQFYQSNRDILNKCDLTNNEEKREDIFELLVGRQDYKRLLMLYKVEKDYIQTEKDYYSKVKKEREEELLNFYNQVGYNLDIVPDHLEYNRNVTSQLIIYFNHQLYKRVVSSSLEILQFFNEVLQVDFQHYSVHLYTWALEGRERSKIINYLLDCGFKVPTSSKFIKDQYSYFINILLLDYSTFKRLILIERAPLLYNPYEKTTITDQLQDYKHAYKPKRYHSIVEFIQVVVHSNYIYSNSFESLIILKLINKLIKYNQHQHQDKKIIKSTINQIKDKYNNKLNNNKFKVPQPPPPTQQQHPEQLDQQSAKQNNNNNNNNNIKPSLFSNIIKYFTHKSPSSSTSSSSSVVSTSTSTSSSSPSSIPELEYKIINEQLYNYYKDIDYSNFNLEREVRRLYIFHFLFPSFIKYDCIYLFNCMVYFSSKYSQLHHLKEFKESYPSKYQEQSSTLTRYLYDVIFYYNDLELYKYGFENGLFIYATPSILLFTYIILNIKNGSGSNDGLNLQDYMELLELFKVNNDPYFNGLAAALIRDQNNDGSDGFAFINSVIQVIKQHYQINNINKDNYVRASDIGLNSSKFNYIYKNHKDLFSGWDSAIRYYNVINNNK